MSDIFNSSHFLRALMKSYQASQENQGAAEISWGSIAHCKSLDFTFLPFTFLPFEDREDQEEGNSHFGYWGRGKDS